jgi:hypothetical protein
VHQRALGLQSAARTLRGWDTKDLNNAETIVKKASTHLECHALLELGCVDNDGVRVLVELLKLMPSDIATLRTSLVASSDRQLQVVTLLLSRLGVADHALFQLKKLIDADIVAAKQLAPVLSASASVPMLNALCTETTGDEVIEMHFSKQCEDKTVYHKILKPFPTIELTGKIDMLLNNDNKI